MKQEYHRAWSRSAFPKRQGRGSSVCWNRRSEAETARRRIGRLILVCAVLILLLRGDRGRCRVAGRRVWELFFLGGYQQLEPFVQTGAKCAG